MHVGAVPIGATPVSAGMNSDVFAGTATMLLIVAEATLAHPGAWVTWYESESVGVRVLDEGIAIDVTPNVGVTTE
ncbi:MAG TPA: hypothetical protein PKV98_04610 [Burkholderiaceae bacterium]|nr:hypothetical protein [Burkholderiaceae bacterium]